MGFLEICLLLCVCIHELCVYVYTEWLGGMMGGAGG